MHGMNKAIFLDRDGTINVDVDYLHETDRLRFIPGVPEALTRLKRMGYYLIVISNQSGIGRNYFGREDVERLHVYMNARLEELGVRIDAFYYCPHVEADHCTCRKPETGMFVQAAGEWNLNMSDSYMVGDRETDILASRELGCRYALLMSGKPVGQELLERYAGCVYKDLLDFALHLEKNGV